MILLATVALINADIYIRPKGSRTCQCSGSSMTIDMAERPGSIGDVQDGVAASFNGMVENLKENFGRKATKRRDNGSKFGLCF